MTTLDWFRLGFIALLVPALVVGLWNLRDSPRLPLSTLPPLTLKRPAPEGYRVAPPRDPSIDLPPPVPLEEANPPAPALTAKEARREADRQASAMFEERWRSCDYNAVEREFEKTIELIRKEVAKGGTSITYDPFNAKTPERELLQKKLKDLGYTTSIGVSW
jgi:hypothetical protein